MVLLKYLHYKPSEFKLPTNVSSLSDVELREANNRINKVMELTLESTSSSVTRIYYNKYTPDQRAMIG